MLYYTSLLDVISHKFIRRYITQVYWTLYHTSLFDVILHKFIRSN